MKKLRIETVRKRELEKSYFMIYTIETKIKIEEGEDCINEREVYIFFGMTLEGKRQYITSEQIKETTRTSDWYNMFQEIKKRKVEHVIFGLLPEKKELREAIKLSFPEIEIFESSEKTIEKLQKYNSNKRYDEIYTEIRKLYLSKDEKEYEINYKMFKEKYGKYIFIMELLEERIKGIKKNYKYSYELRRVVYAFNYMIELKERIRKMTRSREYQSKEEFIEELLYYITNMERAVVYPKYKWVEVINEIYEAKKEYIKPYI